MTQLSFGKYILNLNSIKEGLRIDESNEFLKKYDKDNNSIFSCEEINALKQDLEVAAGEDRALSDNEAILLLAKKMNITIDEAKQKFFQLGNIISEGMQNLNKQQTGRDIGNDMYDMIDDNFKTEVESKIRSRILKKYPVRVRKNIELDEEENENINDGGKEEPVETGETPESNEE